LSPESLTTEQILTALAATPPRIAALTAGLAPAQLRFFPHHGEWSLNDLLAHLRSCADVWGSCIEGILVQERPTLRVVSPRTWIRKTNYLDLEFQPSFQAFTLQRTDLLAGLNPLAPADWSRSATIIKDGKASERTVLFYAQSLALHEQVHIEQIAHVANKMRI
jgi:hypothetical protein